MQVQRVNDINDVPSIVDADGPHPRQGVIYIVEPGANSWIWTADGFELYESRAPGYTLDSKPYQAFAGGVTGPLPVTVNQV